MLSSLMKLEPFQQDSGDPRTGRTENIWGDALNQEYKHLSLCFIVFAVTRLEIIQVLKIATSCH